MDLIYTNPQKVDLGVLQEFSLDMAFGKDENNFELTTTIDQNILSPDSLIYAEGTEYGGIVDTVKVDTDSNSLSYCGRTWHGILQSKIIEPLQGESHYVVNGEANAVIQSLIEYLGLEDLFVASTKVSTINIVNYSMYRYCNAYDGIQRMLNKFGAKLMVVYSQGFCKLYVEPLVTYDLDSSQVGFNLEKHYHPTNHLICLGEGEQEERTVIHLYTDEEGNIVEEQVLTDLDEIAETYEFGNAENDDDLKQNGIDRLKEAWKKDTVEVNLDDSIRYEVGDIIEAVENVTGLQIKTPITKKIVKIENGEVTISYKVGDD